MKRLTTVLASILLTITSAYAGEKADSIFRRYKNVKDCTAVTFDGLIAKLAMSKSISLPEGSELSSMNVLAFERKSFPNTEAIWTELADTLGKSMMHVMEADHEGDLVKIYAEVEEDVIISIVMLLLDNSKNVSAVMLNGSIAAESLDKLMESKKKK